MTPTPTDRGSELSSALEDYLETIYLLVQEQGFARVRDIARARGVKAASVSVALRKLADLDLIRYERREYVTISTSGEQAGRRVLTRHRLLARFFAEVLGMESGAASEQACTMEHSLTDDAMSRLSRFFEFVGTRPQVVDSFRRCQAARPVKGRRGGRRPVADCPICGTGRSQRSTCLADLKPGRAAVVARVEASGARHQRLLDMGILPSTTVHMEPPGPGGEPLWVRCQGARLALGRAEARAIQVVETVG